MRNRFLTLPKPENLIFNEFLKFETSIFDICNKKAKKSLGDYFIPVGAEDFAGLMHKTLAKGKKGEQQLEFYKKAIELLPSSGLLLTIIPAIWLKPDKAGIHKLLIGNPNQINSRIKLLKLHTLSANETNKIFNYQAQTPTTYFLLDSIVLPDDIILKSLILFPILFFG